LHGRGVGSLTPTPPTPARSRSASPPTAPTRPPSSSSTGTSSGSSTARHSATASPVVAAGAPFWSCSPRPLPSDLTQPASSRTRAIAGRTRVWHVRSGARGGVADADGLDLAGVDGGLLLGLASTGQVGEEVRRVGGVLAGEPRLQPAQLTGWSSGMAPSRWRRPRWSCMAQVSTSGAAGHGAEDVRYGGWWVGSAGGETGGAWPVSRRLAQLV
jgi:hypothetical protein